MKTFRIELLIATLALLASAAASIATVIQTSVVGQEMSASVWPYLTIEATFGEDDFKLDVINQGLGPAIVESAELTIEGKRQANWRAAIQMLAAKARQLEKGPLTVKGRLPLTETDFGATTVVRAGESVHLIAVRKTGLGDAFRSGALPPPELTICYCSILSRCWVQRSKSTEQPQPIRDCGNDHAIVTY